MLCSSVPLRHVFANITATLGNDHDNEQSFYEEWVSLDGIDAASLSGCPAAANECSVSLEDLDGVSFYEYSVSFDDLREASAFECSLSLADLLEPSVVEYSIALDDLDCHATAPVFLQAA